MPAHSALLNTWLNTSAPLAAPCEKQPLALPKPLWNNLSSFGFALTKLFVARPVLEGFVKKNESLLSLGKLLDCVSENDERSWAGAGLFACAVTLTENQAVVHKNFLDQEIVTRLSLQLQNAFGNWSSAEAFTALSAPPHANAPLWSALLRLRPLQDFWERELRRNHWNLLTEMMPEAWLFAADPLPPQAVIPRLEMSSWSQLAQLHDVGRSFEITSANEDGVCWALQERQGKEAWKSAIDEALAVAANTALVIVERTKIPEAQTVVTFYFKSEKRVEMVAAFAFSQDASGIVKATPVVKE